MAATLQARRLIRDGSLSVIQALPGISANNTSAAIDIGTGPFNPEEIGVEIQIPDMPLHVTVGNVVQIQLYHGDASNSLAVTTPLIEVDVVGVASTGSVAQVANFKLPPGTKRFIALHQICGVTDDLSSYSITYQVLL